MSTSPLTSAQPDGRVAAIAVSGSVAYIGGSFTHVKDVNGTSVVRNHLAAINISDGTVTPWNPNADGDVYALASDGTNVYVGGAFLNIGGQSRPYLAAVNTTGTVTSWHPSVNKAVRALVTSSSELYVGGDFTKSEGKTVGRLTDYDLGTWTRNAQWTPTASSSVYALAVAQDGSRVYVGGKFTSLNGSSRFGYLAAVDPANGSTDTSFAPSPGYLIYSVATDGNGVYAGGGGAGGHLGTWNLDGSVQHIYQTDGGVQAVTVLGSELYAGGHFQNYCVGDAGQGSPFVCEKNLPRKKLLSVDLSNPGTVTGWNPTLNSSHGVLGMAVDNLGHVYAGGDFTKVNGKARAHLAIFG